MKKTNLLALLLSLTFAVSAQTFNMTLNGHDTTNLCSGTLYDNGGPSGNYANYSSDYFYIDPSGGGSLSITFTSLGTSNYSDRVYVYDGIGPTAILIGSYYYSTLPAGGNAITMTSGKATIFFSSDYNSNSIGFAMNWSAASAAPVAQFTVSNPNPPVNVGVSFTNTSTNGGDLLWDFGDGTSSTSLNPVHKYSAPGSYQAKLISTNCMGTDTSSTQNILVMANPTYTVNPDSLYASVYCGNTATQTSTVNQTGGGTMYYNVSGRQLGANPYVFNEGFESGLGAFSVSPLASSSFAAFATVGGAAQGNGSLFASQYSGNYTGLSANVTASQPTEASYYVKFNNTSDRYGTVVLSDGTTSSANSMYYAYVYNSNLYVSTSSGTFTYPVNVGSWNHIEIKNINWTSKTFDLYINNSSVATGLNFNSSAITQVTNVHVFNTSSGYNFYYDDFKIKNTPPSNLSISPANGVLSSGNSNTVTVSLPTTGMTAGTYEYELLFRTNSSLADSLTVIPFVVDIAGVSTINLSKTCASFGQVYSGLNYYDSVMVTNTGCDSLDISSITSTSSDFSTTNSSMVLAPFDTGYIHINFSPLSIKTYTDTLHLVTNDVDTIICLSANSVGVPVISTDSSSYSVFSYGCNDSIPFSFELINTGLSNLNWNIISSGGSAQNSDDFESGTFGSLWQSTGSAVVASVCNMRGMYAMSTYGTSRVISTVPLNIISGDSISFYVSPGFSGGGAYCETPDGTENLMVQYSTNGISWSTLATIYTSDSPGKRRFLVPPAGISPSTQFRFSQYSFSGGSNDHYIIDDVKIGSSSSGNFNPSTGTTAASDTTVVSGYINVSGKSSGSYTSTVHIASNDPQDSIYSFTINTTVLGEPNIVGPSSCLAFGSVMNGVSVTDTVPVWNSGCDSLLLTGTTSTNADITAAVLYGSVPPGDTGWVEVTFAPTSIATYGDTVFVQSNDTTAAICITGVGLGAPDALISPDSIYASFTSCNDSITIPITIQNGSSHSTLSYQVSTASKVGIRKILVYGPYSYYSQRNNVKNILYQDPDNIIIEETSSLLTNLQGHLDSVSIVLIPRNSGSSYFWTQASPILQTYVNNGGTVLLLMQSHTIHSALALINGYGGFTTLGLSTNRHNSTHPISQGVGALIPYQNTQGEAGYTGQGITLFSSQSSAGTPAMVSVHDYGQGTVINIGYDYYSHNTDTERLLKNAVIWGATATIDESIKVSSDSGTVATNDSVVINVTISSFGLTNGTHLADVTVTTDDPLHPETIIPVVIDINGSSQITIAQSGCVSFTNVLQGATAIDSVIVTNTGCDTLDITGFTGSSTEFGVAGLPISIAPGDSIPMEVTFSPTTVGSFSDTLTILNNDTAVTICVNGTSLGAPVLSALTDTLKVELNKCKVIKNVNYALGNTGLGSMTYDITIGDYSGQSQIAYNTQQATTNHIFNGVPNSDSLMIRIILKGDFDDYYERAYLRIDNSAYGYVYDNNKPNHTLDTIDLLYWGSNIQNLTSDGVLDISLENQYDVDGSAGSFHRVEIFLPAQINWASVVGSTTGNVGANASVNKNILFNAAILGVGTYHTTMNIATNAPGAPNTAVPLQLNVVSKPEITLSDSCLYYPLTLLGDTSKRELTLYNDGCSVLNISSLVPSNNVFKISPSSGSIPVGDSLTVNVDFVPTASNLYNASLIINSNDSVMVICLLGSGAALPLADFAISPENTCLGEVTFVNTTSNTPTSYNWNMGDGSVYNTKDVTHFYSKPGTYTVTLRVTNNAGADTISKTVTVNPLYVDFGMSSDTVLLGAQVNFYDSSITATAWRWNFGDGTTSTVKNPFNSYFVLGKYQVNLEVDDANNCTRNISKDLYVLNHIGLKENLFEALQYTIYPNPSAGKFVLESADTDLKEITLMVSDLNGKVIWEAKGNSSAKSEIDLSNFSKGMYTLSLVKEGRTLTNKKLIVN